MSYLKRAAELDQIKRQPMTQAGKKWTETHPAVSEYLTAEAYPDGGKRKTGTLTVYVDAGEWRVCLKDRDLGCSLWITAASLPEALADLEEALKSPAPAWRKDKEWTAPQGKKKT